MATGFSKTPPASEFHRHSSWGRTRRPKTISTKANSVKPGGTLETPRACAVVTNVAHFDATLAHGTEGRNGYATENQRFLHVTVSGQNAQSVIIYVFHYATGKWSALMVNDGDGTFSQATATTAASDTAAVQPQTFIFEIAGADRVGFLGDGTNDPTVHATCTSF